MTLIYALAAALILLITYRVRGPNYAFAMLVALAALYGVLIWRISTSM